MLVPQFRVVQNILYMGRPALFVNQQEHFRRRRNLMRKPIQRPFQRIRLRRSRQFKCVPVFADKGFPHRVRRPFLTRFAAFLIHKTHIAVDNAERRLFRILVRHKIIHSVVRTLIFQPDFKAVLNVRLFERRTVFHQLLIRFLVKAKVQIGLHRADVQRCAHVSAILLLPTYQPARAKRPKTAEHRNAFLLAAFADEKRNVQHTHQIIYCEVYPFEHRPFFHALAEKFVPSPLLSVQIRFKLPTAFAAQFEQHAHFFQR